MPTKNLSAKFVENVNAPAKGRVEYWDSQINKMALRVTSTGAKSWIVMYRLSGRQVRHTIGSTTAYSLSEARTEAYEVLKRVGRGENPSFEKQLAKMQARDTKPELPESVEAAVKAFIELYAKPKNRSWKETERIFERFILPELGKRALDSITRKEIITILDAIVGDDKHYMANRVLACVRKFFNWCVDRDKIQATPIARLKAPGVERSRDRVLADDELRIIDEAFDTMPYPFGPALKLMLLTAQRRDEVANMRWEQLNLDKAMWVLPRSATKSDRAHDIPLSKVAVEILRGLPQHDRFVFSTKPGRPISGFSKAKDLCDKRCAAIILEHEQNLVIAPWRIHDLRRTFSSTMPRLKVTEHITERILNHSTKTTQSVAAIYNRYAYQEERRDALQNWAQFLYNLRAMPSDKVVELQKRKKAK